jgi:hypothetical protein
MEYAKYRGTVAEFGGTATLAANGARAGRTRHYLDHIIALNDMPARLRCLSVRHPHKKGRSTHWNAGHFLYII